MFLLGSAYPTAKLGINASMPPILFGAMRMGIVFICLIPFCKIHIPNKKYLLPLIAFSLSMGVGVNLFLYLSVEASSIIYNAVFSSFRILQVSLQHNIVCKASCSQFLLLFVKNRDYSMLSME